MSRLQKILALALALELITLAALYALRSRVALLPPVNWQACLIEDTVANQIREMERRLKPDQPASWAELAATYRAFGLFPQADYCYSRMNGLRPGNRSYLYHWAECLDLMGQTQQAARLYAQIIEEGLRSPFGASTAQFCWLNIGQDRLREENVAAAEEALRKAPDISKAKFLLARILVRSGRSKEAIALLDSLLRESPGMVEYNQMKSWAEAEVGNQSAAQESYDRSLRSSQLLPKWDPAHQEVLTRRQNMGSQAWHQKSLELEAQGKIPEATEWSRKAVEAFWTEDRVQQLAKLEMTSGRAQQAISLAEDCVRRVGASAKTLDIIGVASVQLGDRAKAQRAWEQALELEPTPNLFWKLGELAKLSGNAQQARKYQALEQYQMGKEAWLTNDLRSALERFERSTSLADTLPHPWFYLGDTRRLLGDRAGAENAYKRCLQINPDHGRALRGLERLSVATAK